MSTYYANDKYNAVLTAGYSVGQTTLYVSAVPNHVPTIIVAAKGTDKETVFAVTDKTTNSLTGVSRLRGANVDLDAQTPLTCLNNEEFINQLASVSAVFNEEHDETGKHTTDQINEKTANAGVTVDGLKMKDGRIAGWDGWSELTALTRVSDTTATLSGDWTDRLQKGDKLWWKSNGTSRYNYIIGISYSAPNTTITITAGYVSAANDSRFESGQTITEPRYSKVENPQGFPDWFSYVPTIVGASGSAGTYAQDNAYGKFKIAGKACAVQASLRMTNVGSWSGYTRLTLPVDTTAHSSAYQIEGRIVAYNSLATKAFARGIFGNQVAFTALLFNTDYNTWTANDCFLVAGTYQI